MTPTPYPPLLPADDDGGEYPPRDDVRSSLAAIPPAPPVGAGGGGIASLATSPVEMGHLAAFFLAAGSLWQREVVRFIRSPARIIGALGVPILFWAVIGSGLGRSFRPPEQTVSHSAIDAAQTVSGAVIAAAAPHYLAYFFPGSLALILLFTAIFSTISLIEDRREGFLQGVLVSPAPRASLVLGKVLGGTTLAVLQGLLFLLATPLIGLALHPLTALAVAGVMALVAFGLTSLGFVIAWGSETSQGYHSVMNLLLMPMWLLSGALFPASGAARWVQWLIAANPFSYGVALLRRLLTPDDPANAALPSLLLSLSVAAGFGLLLFLAATLLATRSKVVS